LNVSSTKWIKKINVSRLSLQTALERRLPKPLRYFPVLPRFAFTHNPGNDVYTQLPSVHHNPSCDGCARDAE